MRKKKSAKIFLVILAAKLTKQTCFILAAAAAAALIYFLFTQNLSPNGEQSPASQTATPTSSPTPKQIDWQSLIPDIRAELGPEFLGEKIEVIGAINISQAEDITGDGVEEALVGLGNGGVYTEYFTLMIIEDNKPAAAKFRQPGGEIFPAIFLVGASVMNGEDVEMLPEKNAIYSGHYSRAIEGNSFGSLTDCEVEAYQWNDSEKIFEFNTSLSEEIRPDFCRKIGQ